MKQIALDTMKFSQLIVLCIIVFGLQTLAAQEKNEREYKLKTALVPEQIIAYVDQFPEGTKRLRYYKEIDGSNESIEVKLKFNKQWYSIEFDTKGNLQDVEVLLKKTQFNSNQLATIHNYFNTQGGQHTFMRIQEQYVYDNNSEVSEFIRSIFNKTIRIAPNYELVVLSKVQGKNEVNEYVFSVTGEVISKRKVNPSSYEHVLY